MPYIFRIIFFVVGFRTFGLQGALVGVILGYAVDAGVGVQYSRWQVRRYVRSHARLSLNRISFESLFGMMAKLSRVDGAIAKPEIALVERVMNQMMHLNRRQKKLGRELFNAARDSGYTFQFYSAQFAQVHQAHPEILQGMLNILFQLAICDAAIDITEEKLLQSASEIFGLSPAVYNEIRGRYIVEERTEEAERSNANGHDKTNGNGNGNGYRQSADHSYHEQRTSRSRVLSQLEQHYKTLGCCENDSVEQIKGRYRKLVIDFHPDRIVSKELPDEFMVFATEKFRAIQEAYEGIKAARNF